jgi:hypothetical protein
MVSIGFPAGQRPDMTAQRKKLLRTRITLRRLFWLSRLPVSGSGIIVRRAR